MFNTVLSAYEFNTKICAHGRGKKRHMQLKLPPKTLGLHIKEESIRFQHTKNAFPESPRLGITVQEGKSKGQLGQRMRHETEEIRNFSSALHCLVPILTAVQHPQFPTQRCPTVTRKEDNTCIFGSWDNWRKAEVVTWGLVKTTQCNLFILWNDDEKKKFLGHTKYWIKRANRRCLKFPSFKLNLAPAHFYSLGDALWRGTNTNSLLLIFLSANVYSFPKLSILPQDPHF